MVLVELGLENRVRLERRDRQHPDVAAGLRIGAFVQQELPIARPVHRTGIGTVIGRQKLLGAGAARRLRVDAELAGGGRVGNTAAVGRPDRPVVVAIGIEREPGRRAALGIHNPDVSAAGIGVNVRADPSPVGRELDASVIALPGDVAQRTAVAIEPCELCRHRARASAIREDPGRRRRKDRAHCLRIELDVLGNRKRIAGRPQA